MVDVDQRRYNYGEASHQPDLALHDQHISGHIDPSGMMIGWAKVPRIEVEVNVLPKHCGYNNGYCRNVLTLFALVLIRPSTIGI